MSTFQLVNWMLTVPLVLGSQLSLVDMDLQILPNLAKPCDHRWIPVTITKKPFPLLTSKGRGAWSKPFFSHLGLEMEQELNSKPTQLPKCFKLWGSQQGWKLLSHRPHPKMLSSFNLSDVSVMASGDKLPTPSAIMELECSELGSGNDAYPHSGWRKLWQVSSSEVIAGAMESWLQPLCVLKSEDTQCSKKRYWVSPWTGVLELTNLNRRFTENGFHEAKLMRQSSLSAQAEDLNASK